jgi:hypothetical protein
VVARVLRVQVNYGRAFTTDHRWDSDGYHGERRPTPFFRSKYTWERSCPFGPLRGPLEKVAEVLQADRSLRHIPGKWGQENLGASTPPTTPPSTLTPFDLGMLSNSTGFLSVSATNMGKQGQANPSDNAFVSRQQLIQFLTQGLGQNTTFNTTGTGPLASLQDALPYMGTFSRGLSAPSYSPERLTTGIGSTGRLKVLDVSNGGGIMRLRLVRLGSLWTMPSIRAF